MRINIIDSEGLEFFCPFCGDMVLFDDGINDCEHTVYVGLNSHYVAYNHNDKLVEFLIGSESTKDLDKLVVLSPE
jgi:hypothetical protein